MAFWYEPWLRVHTARIVGDMTGVVARGNKADSESREATSACYVLTGGGGHNMQSAMMSVVDPCQGKGRRAFGGIDLYRYSTLLS